MNTTNIKVEAEQTTHDAITAPEDQPCLQGSRGFNLETHGDAKNLCLDERHEQKAQTKKYL
jgi:hypothetical protein